MLQPMGDADRLQAQLGLFSSLQITQMRASQMCDVNRFPLALTDREEDTTLHEEV